MNVMLNFFYRHDILPDDFTGLKINVGHHAPLAIAPTDRPLPDFLRLAINVLMAAPPINDKVFKVRLLAMGQILLVSDARCNRYKLIPIDEPPVGLTAVECATVGQRVLLVAVAIYVVGVKCFHYE
jgi:hypothetical protein